MQCCIGVIPFEVTVGIALNRAETIAPDLQAADPLLQRFLEGAPNRHHLAHRLHLRAEFAVNAGELFKGPARDLGHYIVDRRLKGGDGLLSDVIF